MTEIIEMTEDEWYAKGEELFGPDKMKWRFVCPSCGHVASVEDYKNAGAPQEAVAFSCIGRWTGARPAFKRSDGPCDYAGHGLIRLNPIKLTNAAGDNLRVFAFAESVAAAKGEPMITVGLFVHWTKVSSGSRTLSMQRKDGTVTAINGDMATIKTKSGRLVEIEINRLRLDGQPSQITEFVEAVRQRGR